MSFSSIGKSRRSLRRELFLSMMVLAALVLSMLLSCLFFFGKLSDPKKRIAGTLSLQLDFFENSMTSYWENLTVMGIDLSEDSSYLIQSYLNTRNLTLDHLRGTGRDAYDLQILLIRELSEKLQQTECSGGFILLDDPQHPSEQVPGIYISKGLSDRSDPELLLYRGISSAGKSQNVYPHRKWRMYFQTNLIPDYSSLIRPSSMVADEAYQISGPLCLYGTDEEVYLLTFPLRINDEISGLCGFEVSRRFFRASNPQPTEFRRLICTISSNEKSSLDLDMALDCGKNYAIPNGTFRAKSLRQGVHLFEGRSSYVGMQRTISLDSTEDQYLLTAMIPEADFNSEAARGYTQTAMIISLLIFFITVSCLFFSKSYLKPLLKEISHLKETVSEEATTSYRELDELCEFLRTQQINHNSALSNLEQEKQKAETEAARLAYHRKTEIDPDAYEIFLKGLAELTPSEKRILSLYMEDLSTAEILEQLSIKESTLRFHNKNIYSKLGVSSRKQAVLYARVAKKQAMEESQRRKQ